MRVTQDDGALNVFIGSGQALVLGVNQNTVALQNKIEDPGQYELTISAGGSTAVVITDLVSGGELFRVICCCINGPGGHP